MKQLNIKKEAIIWLVLLLPFVYALVRWNSIPDLVPTHFDMHGKPNDYSSKEFALLGLPGINIILYLFLLFLPRIDPRKRNYEFFDSSYQNIRLLVHLLLVCMCVFSAEAAITGRFMDLHFFGAILFLFFALLGNYFRTVRSNFFVGIRTPWTLSNDEVWRSTHQMAGRLWFYSGLSMALLCLVLPEYLLPYFMVSVLVIITVVPIVFSYREFHRLTKNNPTV